MHVYVQMKKLTLKLMDFMFSCVALSTVEALTGKPFYFSTALPIALAPFTPSGERTYLQQSQDRPL